MLVLCLEHTKCDRKNTERARHNSRIRHSLFTADQDRPLHQTGRCTFSWGGIYPVPDWTPSNCPHKVDPGPKNLKWCSCQSLICLSSPRPFVLLHTRVCVLPKIRWSACVFNMLQPQDWRLPLSPLTCLYLLTRELLHPCNWPPAFRVLVLVDMF